MAEWTRSRLWLRVAPPGFIGRRRGRSSHKRQLSKRPALIGPAPLTHRPRRTVQHFFTPSPLLLQKKKREREMDWWRARARLRKRRRERVLALGAGPAGRRVRAPGRRPAEQCPVRPRVARPAPGLPVSPGPPTPGPSGCGCPRAVSDPVGKGQHRCEGAWLLWAHT